MTGSVLYGSGRRAVLCSCERRTSRESGGVWQALPSSPYATRHCRGARDDARARHRHDHEHDAREPRGPGPRVCSPAHVCTARRTRDTERGGVLICAHDVRCVLYYDYCSFFGPKKAKSCTEAHSLTASSSVAPESLVTVRSGNLEVGHMDPPQEPSCLQQRIAGESRMDAVCSAGERHCLSQYRGDRLGVPSTSQSGLLRIPE